MKITIHLSIVLSLGGSWNGTADCVNNLEYKIRAPFFKQKQQFMINKLLKLICCIL